MSESEMPNQQLKLTLNDVKPNRCRFCGKLMEEGSVRCTECASDQLRIHSPNWRALAAIGSILIVPIVVWGFQRGQTIAAYEEHALKDASAELTEASRIVGDLVGTAVALSEPCFLESSKDEQTCSRELLARLVAFDRNVAAFGWRMTLSINRPDILPHYDKFDHRFWNGEKGWRWRIRYAVFGLNGVGVPGGLLNCVKTQDSTCQEAKMMVDQEVLAMSEGPEGLKELSCFLVRDAKQTRLSAVATISPSAAYEVYEGLQHSGHFCHNHVEPLKIPTSGVLTQIKKWSGTILKSAPSP